MPYKNRHPLYYVWTSMVQRCHKPTHPAFKWYGARGISVCQHWREDFAAFAVDMGERPPGLTLERKDTDGNYEPSNCVWATQRDQQRNRTNTKLTKPLADQITALVKAGASKQAVADQFGVSRTMVRKIVEGKAWQ